jgi:hypothetical protein
VPHVGTLMRELRRYMDPIAVGRMAPGDVVAMAWRDEPMHVAVIGDGGRSRRSLIHSYAGLGRVVEHEIDAEWLARIAKGGAFRFPGIDEVT